MNPDRLKGRRRRKTFFQPEMLESRALLTGGAGNNFAIMQTTIATANQKATVPFTIDPKLITLTPKHQITLGIDVAAQSGSSIVPRIVAVQDLQTHQMIPITRGTYSKAVRLATPGQGTQTTAVLTTLRFSATQAKSAHNYAVIIQGKGGTTGQTLVGFYLPGDVNGDGTVNSTDIASVKTDMNATASSQNYVFGADSNRDGVINSSDLRTAQANLGTAVNITPVVSANLNSSTDSGIQDRVTNIQDVIFQGQATPGAVVTFTDTNNTAPMTKATADVNGNYALQIPLGAGSNTFNVSATDGFGQTISGTISPVTYSLTAPVAVTPSSVAATTTTPTPANGSTTPTGTG